MNKLIDTLRRYLEPKKPLPTGVYHYQTPPDAPQQYRLHLRLDNEGQGILIVNAKTVLHLNQTASEYAYHIVKQTPESEAVNLICKRYRGVDQDQVLQDFKGLQEKLTTLITTPDLDPELFLDFERHDPYSQDISAPYRLDCALTYRMEEISATDAAPVDRVVRDLDTSEWKIILDKAWNAGIPHVVFTGGEPTLRPDLPELVAYAEKLGMVSGILSTGLRFTDPEYRFSLLQSGLDHIMLVLLSEKDQSWDALRDILAEDIFVTVHLTLTAVNQVEFITILDRLVKMGVKSISLSASEISLAPQLQLARQHCAEHELTLVWDLPVPYSPLHPVALELAEQKIPEGAGRAWIYIEPDGDVLPAQGITLVMGNILTDSWETVWKNRSVH
jgi:organic radical activating enzyme